MRRLKMITCIIFVFTSANAWPDYARCAHDNEVTCQNRGGILISYPGLLGNASAFDCYVLPYIGWVRFPPCNFDPIIPHNIELTVDGISLDSPEVIPNVPTTISVYISGSGFETPETRDVVIILRTSTQALQKTIPLAQLADDPSLGTVVKFDVTFPASVSGTDTVTATINPANTLAELDLSDNSATMTLDVHGPAMLHVNSARFVQVIGDPQISSNRSTNVFDAVLNKSASFKAFLKGINLPTTGTATVRVTGGGTELAHTSSIPLSAIRQSILANGYYEVPPGKFLSSSNTGSYIPKILGLMPLTFNVVVTGPPVATKPYSKISINVHQVAPLKLGFAALNDNTGCIGADCAGSPNPANVATLAQTNSYISRAFPTPDNSVTSVTGSPISVNNSLNLIRVYNLNFILDFLELESKRQKLGADRMIGVVSDRYFTYRGDDDGTVGITPNANVARKSVLVQENVSEGVAHELAHSYGIKTELYIEDPDNSEIYKGTPVSGYDALGRMGYIFDPAVPLFEQIQSIMGPPRSPLGNADLDILGLYWPDNNTYRSLLDTFISGSPDPEVILISGILTKSGEFIPGPSTVLQNGELTLPDETADLTISTIDSNGKVLNSIGLQPDFTATAIRKAGAAAKDPTIDLGAMPIVVTLPNTPGVTSIQVTKNAKVLTTTSLNGQLLADLIASIPDNAFKSPCRSIKRNRNLSCAEKGRTELDKLVSKIQKILNSKKPSSAILPLKALILEVKFLTAKIYTVSDSSELNQDEVVNSIKDIILNLESGVKHSHRKCKARKR